MIGSYRGHEWKKHRICDMFTSNLKAVWFFLYHDGEPTGDHFRTLGELKEYIDALPTVVDRS